MLLSAIIYFGILNMLISIFSLAFDKTRKQFLARYIITTVIGGFIFIIFQLWK